jgi:hypothetical protein
MVASRVVAVGGEEFRDATRDAVAALDDLDLVGEAKDATSGVVVCSLAAATVVVLEHPVDERIVGRIENASPGTRVVVSDPDSLSAVLRATCLA